MGTQIPQLARHLASWVTLGRKKQPSAESADLPRGRLASGVGDASHLLFNIQ